MLSAYMLDGGDMEFIGDIDDCVTHRYHLKPGQRTPFTGLFIWWRM